MKTKIGKLLWQIRYNNNELLYHMAKKLDVTTVYLSKVENGIIIPPKSWYDKICSVYDITEDQKAELSETIMMYYRTNSPGKDRGRSDQLTYR